MIRGPEEIAKMRKAGRVVAEIHEKTRAAIRPGVSTGELDRIARKVIDERGARSNFLNYRGGPGAPPFPGVICTSPNNMVVHGIPSDDVVLEEGDIISVDAGAIVEGYHGDAAYTAGVGKISKEAQKLLDVTEASMWAGIEMMCPGNRLHDVGAAVQKVVEAEGLGVVREYVGHAIGTAMHEDPQLPNYWPGTPGPKLKVGMVFAIEPMVNVGGIETEVLEDRWAVVTSDGSLSAHFESTVAILEDGPEVLTIV